MSCRLLQNPEKIHEVQDDLESHFYLVLYLAMRYMSHNMTHDILSTMDALFDDYIVHHDGTATGGDRKISFIITKQPPRLDNNPALNDFMPAAQEYFTEWIWNTRGAVRNDETTSHLALHDHSKLLSLFEKTYTSGQWPENDAAKDYLPRKRTRDDRDDEAPQKSRRSSLRESASSSMRSCEPFFSFDTAQLIGDESRTRMDSTIL